MILEAMVGGGVVWCLLKTKVANKIKGAVSDFKQGFNDEAAQNQQEVHSISAETQAAYDFVLRDMVEKAKLEELQVIVDLFCKYGPPRL